MRFNIVRLTTALFFIIIANSAVAQSVVRGPYLQQQSQDSIIVRWRTDIATDAEVLYGTSDANLNLSSIQAIQTTEHSVQLTGLSPSTTYYYSVGTTTVQLAGDDSYHFITSPVQGAASDTRIWVIGDSGTANSNARAVRDAYKIWSVSQPANFMLMLGDNAYNDGTDAEYQTAVFDTYPELLRQLPVWSTLGNHDGHSADSGTQSGPYYDIFEFPTAAEVGGLASGTEAYYSFEYGNIHFVVLDSYETDRSPGGNMLQWLESDLAMNDRPWVIAFFHHPPYTKGSHNSDTEGRLIDMRQNALPILEAWGVDLVLTGHSHTYERSFLLDGHYGLSGTLDIDTNILDIGDGSESGDGVYQKPESVAAQNEGAVYAVAGSSGKVTYGKPLDHPAMLVALESLGSMILDISGNRMDVSFLDQNALVQDEFTIMKTPDIEAPLISSAVAEDATHVLVNYSEKVDAAGAVNTANYAISGLAINAAELLPGNKTVRLTTSVMTAGNNYILTVNNVMDESGNTIAPDTQAGFEFSPTMTMAFQDGLAPDANYNGTMDSYIREATATTNYGAATTIQVDGDEPSGSGTDMNIVIGWDISGIPATATVESASITLNTLNVGGPYGCYGLSRAWTQAEVTWNEASSGIAWESPGAGGLSDRGSLSLCVLNADFIGPITINLNVDGLALVQSWVDGSVDNNGIIITDSATANGADFDSSESSNAMKRPKLEIVYTVPVDPPNNAPVAAFSEICTYLDCNFSDDSSDSDGSIDGWDWDFGDGQTSSLQNPVHAYAASGTYTVSLTVTDNDGDTDNTTTDVTVTEPPQSVDYTATGQLLVAGTVTGSYVDTQTDDGVNQSIRERESGGKKRNRYSFMEHKWIFNVSPAAGFVLNLNAWSSGSADGDGFVFAWSTDNNTYTDLMTVSDTSSANVQMALLPNSLNGAVYIRVRDSDRTAGNKNLGTIFVDHLYIHADNAPGSPPSTPSGLAASALSASSIELLWTDTSDDELSFELQRSTDQSNWAGLSNPAADATMATDTGLLAATTYYYRVRAFNLSGSSSWSTTASATTDPGPPPPAISLALSGSKSRGKHVIALDWSGVVTANVVIYRDGGLLDTVADSGVYTDYTGNKGGRTYVYQVCEAGSNSCSAEESITF